MKKIRLTYTHYASVINYLFFGGLTTLINIGVFTMFNQFTSLNYQLANIIAWFLSVLFAYITNKLWVFSSKTNTRTALAREIASFFLFLRSAAMPLLKCEAVHFSSALHASWSSF